MLFAVATNKDVVAATVVGLIAVNKSIRTMVRTCPGRFRFIPSQCPESSLLPYSCQFPVEGAGVSVKVNISLQLTNVFISFPCCSP